MIKAVLFDIDNTLLDFDEYVKESMKIGFEKFGLGEYNDEIYKTFEEVNGGVWRRLERGEISYEELLKIRWNTVFSALGIDFDGVVFEKFFKDGIFDNAIVISGAYEILEYLQGKYILGVAGNGPLVQQTNRLRIAGLDKFFPYVFLSEAVGHSKPSGKFFEHCLRTINAGGEGILPGEILMVGDSLTSDIKGACDAGFATCFFDKRKRGVSGNFSPDHVIEELTELRKII